MMSLAARFYARADYHQLLSYARIMECIGWDIIPTAGAYLFVRRVGPVAFAKLQHPEKINVQELVKLQRELHILQLFVEPALAIKKSELTKLQAAGFKFTTNHHAYTKTMVCDIAGTPEQILHSFSRSTAYHMRRSQKNGVHYDVVPFGNLSETQKQQILALHRIWSREKHVAGYADNFLFFLWQTMQREGKMILASKDGTLEGVLFLLTHHRVGMYFYQFSSARARQELLIPTGLAYQAILESKHQGCDIFDFCSAYDERYPQENPRWQGFSTHKERFHPTPIYYPPALVRTHI